MLGQTRRHIRNNAVASNFATGTVSDLVCFKCDAVFPNISGRPRRMVVAVLLFQLFSRYEPVLQNLFEHGAGSLSRYFSYANKWLCGNLLRHGCADYVTGRARPQ
jgi:hypothetical protein